MSSSSSSATPPSFSSSSSSIINSSMDYFSPQGASIMVIGLPDRDQTTLCNNIVAGDSPEEVRRVCALLSEWRDAVVAEADNMIGLDIDGTPITNLLEITSRMLLRVPRGTSVDFCKELISSPSVSSYFTSMMNTFYWKFMHCVNFVVRREIDNNNVKYPSDFSSMISDFVFSFPFEYFNKLGPFPTTVSPIEPPETKFVTRVQHCQLHHGYSSKVVFVSREVYDQRTQEVKFITRSPDTFTKDITGQATYDQLVDMMDSFKLPRLPADLATGAPSWELFSSPDDYISVSSLTAKFLDSNIKIADNFLAFGKKRVVEDIPEVSKLNQLCLIMEIWITGNFPNLAKAGVFQVISTPPVRNCVDDRSQEHHIYKNAVFFNLIRRAEYDVALWMVSDSVMYSSKDLYMFKDMKSHAVFSPDIPNRRERYPVICIAQELGFDRDTSKYSLGSRFIAENRETATTLAKVISLLDHREAKGLSDAIRDIKYFRHMSPKQLISLPIVYSINPSLMSEAICDFVTDLPKTISTLLARIASQKPVKKTPKRIRGYQLKALIDKMDCDEKGEFVQMLECDDGVSDDCRSTVNKKIKTR